jgi:hypothetical protein
VKEQLFRFHVVCPKCNHLSETVKEGRVPDPQVKCGECLFTHVEIVAMKVVAVTPVAR